MADKKRSGAQTPVKKASRWRFPGKRRSVAKMETSPAPVLSPSPERIETPPSVELEPRPESEIQKLLRTLSLQDDPSQFGAGTLAARRLQREELDAAMAQNLFTRELARGLVHQGPSGHAANASASPTHQLPQNPMDRPVGYPPGHPNGPLPRERPRSNPASRHQQVTPEYLRQHYHVDVGGLEHIRSAFTDSQWEEFTANPVRYINIHGLPQEVEVERATESHDLLLTEYSPIAREPENQDEPGPLKVPSVEQDIRAGVVQSTGNTNEFPTTTSPQKGMTNDEISRVMVTFTQQETCRANASKGNGRVKGRNLPKGAKTKGIISEDESLECSICLLDIEVGQRVGLLPCCHRFHIECVMSWLKKDSSCPECRDELRQHIQ